MSKQERLNQALLEIAWGEEATNCEEIEDLIVKKGADVTYQDEYGKTALHYAAKGGREECVEILLNNGAGVTIHTEDNEGNTPFSLAKYLKRYHNDADVLNIFKAYEKEQKLQEKEAMMTNEEKRERNKRVANMAIQLAAQETANKNARSLERTIQELREGIREYTYKVDRAKSENDRKYFQSQLNSWKQQLQAITKSGGKRRKTHKAKKSKKSKKTRRHL